MSDLLTDLQQNNQLNYSTLNQTGFEFLCSYFLSINEKEERVSKIQPKLKPKVERMGYYSSSSWVQTSHVQAQDEADIDEDEGPNFELRTSPAELEKLEMIWEIVEQVIEPDVSRKATTFLINVHMSLEADLAERRAEFCQMFISKCIGRLSSTNEDRVILRNIQILS